MDKLQTAFVLGIPLKERYIHLNEFFLNRVGEEQDIIQATIRVEYLDRILRPTETAEIMEEMEANIKVNGGNTTWQS